MCVCARVCSPVRSLARSLAFVCFFVRLSLFLCPSLSQNASGRVLLSDLRGIIASFGEALTDGEFAELMKGVPVETDGSLSLASFNKVLAKDDAALAK